jgi:hypothetical protein
MAKTLSVHLNLGGNRKGVVDVKDVVKNRWKNAVRSESKACMCVKA